MWKLNTLLKKKGAIGLIISGRGGQGVLLAGYILGVILIRYRGYYVVNTEHYSAETRGGDSVSELAVFLNSEHLGPLKIQTADVAIFMYLEQMLKYSKRVDNKAFVLLDSTYIKKPLLNTWNSILLPFAEIAEKETGTRRVANMVMLGAFSVISGLYTLDELLEVIKESTPKDWQEINSKAAQSGYEAAYKLIREQGS